MPESEARHVHRHAFARDEDALVGRDQRIAEFVGDREIRSVIGGEPAQDPLAHRREIGLEKLKLEVGERDDEAPQVVGGPVPPAPQCIEQLERQEGRRNDREIAPLERSAERPRGIKIGFTLRLEPFHDNRRVDARVPQRASRSARMAAVESSPGVGFRANSSSSLRIAARTRGDAPGPRSSPSARLASRARYALRDSPSAWAARSTRRSSASSNDTNTLATHRVYPDIRKHEMGR